MLTLAGYDTLLAAHGREGLGPPAAHTDPASQGPCPPPPRAAGERGGHFGFADAVSFDSLSQIL